MRCYQINTDLFRSASVDPSEVFAVEMDPGDTLYCKGRAYTWGEPTVCIADRVNGSTRGASCTMIRQVLPCPYRDWSQDYIDPNRKARDRARRSGCQRVTVPGGVPPLTLEGQIAVPDFSMSGTSWFIANESILLVNGVRPHLLGTEQGEKNSD